MNALLNGFDLTTEAGRGVAADYAEQHGLDGLAWVIKQNGKLSRKSCKQLCEQMEFSGRKIKIEAKDTVKLYGNYWDDGSRSYYWLYNGTTAHRLPDSFEALDVAIHAGCVIAEHVFFCGKDCGITIKGDAETLRLLFA